MNRFLHLVRDRDAVERLLDHLISVAVVIVVCGSALFYFATPR